MLRLAWVTMTGLAACSPAEVLIVDVRTNYVPWLEFDRVEVELYPGAEAAAPVHRASAPLSGEVDARTGIRAAELRGLARGSWLVRARLARGADSTGIGRVQLDWRQRSRAVTVMVTRECSGVMCPGDGSPSAIGCLGGDCLDPGCSPEMLDSCPRECERDADCTPAPGAPACAVGWCLAHACVTRFDDTRCGGGACLPELGCVNGRVDAGAQAEDGAIRDASVLDAATDAAPPDAGVDGGGVGARWVSVEGGITYTCGLRSDGRLYCWGQWILGIPGASQSTLQPVPVQVANPPGFSGRWATLRASFENTCALDTAGQAFCWGSDRFGAVGDDEALSDADVAARVVDPTGFSGAWRDLTVGDTFVCGLDSAGSAYCWGRDEHGILGDGDPSVVHRGTPGRVADPVGFSGAWIDLRAGLSHSCGVDTAGRGYCWGYDFGPLAVAVPDPPSGQWRTIHAGDGFRCGLTTLGELFCWGIEVSANLGDGPPDMDQAAPVPVAPETRFRQLVLDSNARHACAITVSDELLCWGGENRFGEVSPTLETEHVPRSLLDSVRSAGIGATHTCAVLADGSAWCVGWGREGQLGDGRIQSSSTLVRVDDLGG